MAAHQRATCSPARQIAKAPEAGGDLPQAESALKTLAAQWKKRFDQIEKATPASEFIPPVMIVVCDNTEIAEVFYRKISGERTEEVASDGLEEATETDRVRRQRHFPSFAETEPGAARTIRIDTEAAGEDRDGRRRDQGRGRRGATRVIATVGKRGEPGEHVRCVVSVSMLTEGWDANNVTHILGVRAFGSQLLCEQVVGRGLRRMNYTLTKGDGLLAPNMERVRHPFSLIPFKGKETEDRPVVYHHESSLPERASFEIRSRWWRATPTSARRAASGATSTGSRGSSCNTNRRRSILFQPVATATWPQVVVRRICAPGPA